MLNLWISNKSVKNAGEVLNARLTEFPGELVTDEVTACWSYQLPGTALRALPGPGTSTRVPVVQLVCNSL